MWGSYIMAYGMPFPDTKQCRTDSPTVYCSSSCWVDSMSRGQEGYSEIISLASLPREAQLNGTCRDLDLLHGGLDGYFPSFTLSGWPATLPPAFPPLPFGVKGVPSRPVGQDPLRVPEGILVGWLAAWLGWANSHYVGGGI